MKRKIEATIDSVNPEIQGAGLSCFHEVDSTLYSAGGTTFIGQAYSLFDLKFVAGPSGDYPQLTNEAIIQVNPDFIPLVDHGDTDSVTKEDVAFRPGWNEITTMKNGQVAPLDSNLASRWGPRLPQLIQDIAEALRSYQWMPAPIQ